ncbi:MAG: alpha/beta fold hydrolase, partial [Cellvibrionales bacterium]|nr:alpha/beta fold hydrolase [Cellvibrionales bacterium]
VLIVHGYYDHLGLYRHVVRFFLDQGYAVLGFDLPGHGLSSGQIAAIHDFDEYARAIHDVVTAASVHLPPLTLGFGQSTGCAAWMNYLMTGFTSPVEKLVLLSPLLRPASLATTRALAVCTAAPLGSQPAARIPGQFS